MLAPEAAICQKSWGVPVCDRGAGGRAGGGARKKWGVRTPGPPQDRRPWLAQHTYASAATGQQVDSSGVRLMRCALYQRIYRLRIRFIVSTRNIIIDSYADWQ
jgi:hypothetical protein